MFKNKRIVASGEVKQVVDKFFEETKGDKSIFVYEFGNFRLLYDVEEYKEILHSLGFENDTKKHCDVITTLTTSAKKKKAWDFFNEYEDDKKRIRPFDNMVLITTQLTKLIDKKRENVVSHFLVCAEEINQIAELMKVVTSNFDNQNKRKLRNENTFIKMDMILDESVIEFSSLMNNCYPVENKIADFYFKFNKIKEELNGKELSSEEDLEKLKFLINGLNEVKNTDYYDKFEAEKGV